VTRRFGSRRVLEGVSAEATDGECLVVTGPNGSGKSTLLAILAGLLRPSSGRVSLADESGELEGDRRRDAIALVAPDLSLYAELTALENLSFAARLRGLDDDRASLLALLDRVG